MMHAIICGEASMMMMIMTMMMHAAPCNFIMGRWLPQDRQSLQVPQRILDAEPSRPTDGEGGGEEQEAPTSEGSAYGAEHAGKGKQDGRE
jgi:hypothetical protein